MSKDKVSGTDKERSVEINNKGVRHFLNGQFGPAEESYSEALKLDPENVTALNNMGLLHHQKKKYSEAIQYFEKAIRIKPAETYHVNAGNAAACINEMDRAKSWYQKALEINRNSIPARESLANLYEYNGRIPEAAELWVDLINTTGKEKFKIEYAKNLIKQEKFAEAVEILYNQTSGSERQIWYLAGLCEFQLKNYGLAVQALKKGLAIDPDHEETRRYLAVTYIKMGEAAKGADQLDKIIRMNPENYQILTEKGVILLSRNQPEEALKLFEKSLAIKPGYKKAEKYRAMAREVMANAGEE